MLYAIAVMLYVTCYVMLYVTCYMSWYVMSCYVMLCEVRDTYGLEVILKVTPEQSLWWSVEQTCSLLATSIVPISPSTTKQLQQVLSCLPRSVSSAGVPLP